MNIRSLALLVLSLGTGCVSGSWSHPTMWFDDPKTAYEKQLETQTTREQIKLIHASIRGISRKGADEQARISEQLASRIQSEEDPFIRREIIRALAKLETPQALAVLQAAMSDSDTDVRIAACKAWGNIGGAQATTLLGTALGSDSNIDVRIAAAKELGNVEDPRTAKVLATGLEDSDPALQLTALESLELVSGANFDKDVNLALRFAKGEVKDVPQTSLAQRVRNLF